MNMMGPGDDDGDGSCVCGGGSGCINQGSDD
jgi:hypothetical protein